MHCRRRQCHHDQAAIRGARECGEAALDRFGVVRGDRYYLHPERWRRALDGTELTHAGGICWVSKYRHPRDLGRDLFEQLQPFGADRELVHGEAGGVAARPRQAIDKTAADRIGDQYENDRHHAGCLPHGPSTRCGGRQDDIRPRAVSSAAYRGKRSASPPAQRTSMSTLRPTAKPASCSPCRNAATRLCPSGSSAARCMSTPIRRIFCACCARAASGHAAAPPSSAMNARRLMSDMGACSPALCQGYGCTVGSPRIQDITERTVGPWATPEMF